MAVQPKRRAEAAKNPEESGYEKLAVTMPRQTVGRARARVKAGDAKSLSAFVSQAVEEKLERDRLQDVLDEIFGEQPMTDEEREWADRLILGR